MKASKALGLVLSLLIAVGCGKKGDGVKAPPKNTAAPSPEAQASPEIGKSFTKTDVQPGSPAASPTPTPVPATSAPATPPITPAQTDRSHVVVKKAALEKEFILMTSLVKVLPAPQFEAMESLIVSFIKRDGKIFMLNATHIQEVGNNRSPLILAEFAILSENEEQIEFDFNAGMKQLFTMSTPVDPNETHENLGQEIAQINLSYLDQVKFENEAMFIKQIAQFKKDDLVMPAEVRYLIKPYSPDPSFAPFTRRTQETGMVGYFANALGPIDQNGEIQKLANKWHDSKPVTFAISANTPADMRETIKSGLLYWNRILGSNKINVIQLEDPAITAPRIDMNIVQWVDWDNMGTAYADWHSDPRTGEILSANIFYPSGKPPVRHARMELYELGIKGFKLTTVADPVHPNTPDQDQFQASTKKIVMNNVFVVIAHEMGHIMGLAHNFAGTASASYDHKDRKSLLQNFVQNNTLPDDLVVSSSVMDYLRPADKAMMGEMLLRNQSAVLSYDAMAISHLYLNQPLPSQGRPAYCSHGHEAIYADCMQFDSGKSVVSFAKTSYEESLESLPRDFYRMYFPVNPLRSDAINPREVSLNTTNMAAVVTEHFNLLVSLLKSAQFISVRSPHMPILRQQNNSIYEEELQYLTAEIQKFGGLTAILSPLDDDNFSSNIISKFIQLLEENNAETNRLSAEDKTYMVEQVRLASRSLRSKIILAEISILSGKDSENPDSTDTWAESDLTNELARINEQWFLKYAMSKDSDTTTFEITMQDGSKSNVVLPFYNYSDAVRTEASKLFSGKADALNWAYSERLRSTAALETEIKLLGDLTKINKSKLSTEASYWLLTNENMVKNLKKVPTPPSN